MREKYESLIYSKKITKSLFIVVLTLIIFVIATCCLWPQEVYKEGMDGFHVANSSYDLAMCLLPSDNFHKTYPYIDANYYFSYKRANFRYTVESLLMYLRYDSETYKLAKENAVSTISLSEENRFLYNGYQLIENQTMQEAGSPFFHFPDCWNMIAYNDDKCELVFMGFYIGPEFSEKDKELLAFSDIGAFLAEYFSFYDFSPAEEADAGTGTTTANTNVPAQPDP